MKHAKNPFIFFFSFHNGNLFLFCVVPIWGLWMERSEEETRMAVGIKLQISCAGFNSLFLCIFLSIL